MIRQERCLWISSVLLLTGSLTGCMTWQTRDVAPAEYVTNQKPYQIRVESTDGSHRVIYWAEVRNDRLVGSSDSKPERKDRAIALEEVRSVASPHVSPVRTALIGVVVVAAGIGAYTMAAGNYSW